MLCAHHADPLRPEDVAASLGQRIEWRPVKSAIGSILPYGDVLGCLHITVKGIHMKFHLEHRNFSSSCSCSKKGGRPMRAFRSSARSRFSAEFQIFFCVCPPFRTSERAGAFRRPSPGSVARFQSSACVLSHSAAPPHAQQARHAVGAGSSLRFTVVNDRAITSGDLCT